MKIVKSVIEMQETSEFHRLEGKKIALVPTMGYLHKGHVSLIEKAREIADIVITTLFVNPTQFGPNEDYENYPRDFDRDVAIAEKSGSEYLFSPARNDMYPPGYSGIVKINNITEVFEGASRPGHFDGVATVVSKLFNITKPHFAVFGQKDYQQSLLIKHLVKCLNFHIDIVISPTVREEDGLARSSRNIYLSPELRSKANIIYKALEYARVAVEEGERNRKVINALMHRALRSVPEIRIDYASSVIADSLVETDTFESGTEIVLLIAVYLGRTRLIDNALLKIR